MYPVLLFVHSWLRWLVLIAVIYAIARSARGLLAQRPWTGADVRTSRVALGLIDLQFTLGLVLYLFLSPIVRGAFADFGAAMRSAPLRFFAIEHITAMLIAVSLAHLGAARAERSQGDRLRHRALLLGSSGFLIMALAGMPWPFLKHGRPLLRTELSQQAAEPSRASAPELYLKRCAPCHGAGGRGDGLAASAMQPRPRDFAEARWQASLSDRELAQVIKGGGLTRQLSASMPAHPDLSSAQIEQLIRFVRSVSKP